MASRRSTQGERSERSPFVRPRGTRYAVHRADLLLVALLAFAAAALAGVTAAAFSAIGGANAVNAAPATLLRPAAPAFGAPADPERAALLEAAYGSLRRGLGGSPGSGAPPLGAGEGPSAPTAAIEHAGAFWDALAGVLKSGEWRRFEAEVARVLALSTALQQEYEAGLIDSGARAQAEERLLQSLHTAFRAFPRAYLTSKYLRFPHLSARSTDLAALDAQEILDPAERRAIFRSLVEGALGGAFDDEAYRTARLSWPAQRTAQLAFGGRANGAPAWLPLAPTPLCRDERLAAKARLVVEDADPCAFQILADE